MLPKFPGAPRGSPGVEAASARTVFTGCCGVLSVVMFTRDTPPGHDWNDCGTPLSTCCSWNTSGMTQIRNPSGPFRLRRDAYDRECRLAVEIGEAMKACACTVLQPLAARPELAAGQFDFVALCHGGWILQACREGYMKYLRQRRLFRLCSGTPDSQYLQG